MLDVVMLLSRVIVCMLAARMIACLRVSVCMILACCCHGATLEYRCVVCLHDVRMWVCLAGLQRYACAMTGGKWYTPRLVLLSVCIV